MDAMNIGLLLLLRPANRDGSFAGRPVAATGPKGGGKGRWPLVLGAYHCISAAAAAVVMGAAIQRRE